MSRWAADNDLDGPITYRQATEEEAREIARRCGQVYDPSRLHEYKYADTESRSRLKDATPFIPPTEKPMTDTPTTYPFISPAAERVRRDMQEQLDLGRKALELYEDETGNEQLPAPHELTAFLMRRLKKTQLALRVAVEELRLSSRREELISRLEKLL